jgi:hypothetical protein
MLTIYGNKTDKFCDGISRRNFLQIGGLAAGSLSLPALLRCDAVAKEGSVRRSGKSVIMICLGGGPSHIDMYDMRPEAPVEYRGEFQPIASRVPGMQMCELMPRQAEIAHRFSVVRSLQWLEPCHQFSEICTGFPTREARPSFGSIVNRLYTGGSGQLPRFVDLAGDGDKVKAEEPRYAGSAYRAFAPHGPDLENLSLTRGVTLDRLSDRKRLLSSFDQLRQTIDHSSEMSAVDAFRRQALDIVSSQQVFEAFDISKESPELLARYGNKEARFRYLDVQYGFDFELFVRARRLVEAGVPLVSLNVARWDHHCLDPAQGTIFDSYRTLLPLYDMAIAALIEDLHERGLDQDVAVVVWGEFGRTPRVNKTGGRDHWPAAGFALVAGGGLKMGQYIGETDLRAERPKTRVYGPQNMLATLYHVLGIDPAVTIPNEAGRPMPLLDDCEPIRELL